MADNKNDRGGRDRLRVDINDPSEVEYLHSQWRQFTHAEIVDAIANYGPMRHDIENYLRGKGQTA